MKILVTGLCTLHWGRLEFGNIGNYYIIEPLFRELHRVFPLAEISTTFQMTEEFQKRENVHVLPMTLYYAWQETDLVNAMDELASVRDGHPAQTEYIRAVRDCDLLLNVSGDMWGDNAEHVGPGRFLVDLCKMRTAQLLGVKTVLFGVTPGPFSDASTVDFAKEVFSHFDLVINREPTSSANLKEWGFDVSKTKDFACPAFLYTPRLSEAEDRELEALVGSLKTEQPFIGFTIGGFNMPVGPYDMWPRPDAQYTVFARVIEHIVNERNGKVVLISHTNGFCLPPHFQLINGRDFPILKQLREVLTKRKRIADMGNVVLLDTPRLPAMTKAIIGKFDFMITGRVHASVAAVSQCVPAVFLTYEQSFIPSTKMSGFSSLCNLESMVCAPSDFPGIIKRVDRCMDNREQIVSQLKTRIREVKQLASLAFDELETLF